MKHLALTLFLLIVCVAPAAALPLSFDFVFTGAAYGDNSAVVSGTIVFDSTVLQNPGYYAFDLTIPGQTAVTALNVTVNNTIFGGGVYTMSDFVQVVFDTSTISLDLTRQLVGQTTSSPTGQKWGTIEDIPGSTPPQSYTGDFEIFASATSDAPTGIWPYQLGTANATGDGVQLVSFAPSSTVPEPSTWLLVAGGAGLLALVRRRGTRAPA